MVLAPLFFMIGGTQHTFDEEILGFGLRGACPKARVGGFDSS
jgi:hypothetical protein